MQKINVVYYSDMDSFHASIDLKTSPLLDALYYIHQLNVLTSCYFLLLSVDGVYVDQIYEASTSSIINNQN